jgi:acetoin utilization deacetylase AcuC-like enzyme
MLDILYQISEGHVCIDDHNESPLRVIKAIDFLTQNEPYMSMVKNHKLKPDKEILDLIIKSQGQKILKTFIIPDTNLSCYSCDNLFDGSILCPKCGSDNIEWRIGYDTYVNNRSATAVKECISVLMSALDSVLLGNKYQYCLIRPPGHHNHNKGRGFCLVNNVFILSEYAVDQGYERVLILDYDHHHFDGTAELIKPAKNRNRFGISMHAHSTTIRIYPGTGSEESNKINIKNIPLNLNCIEDKNKYTDDVCLKKFREKAIPWIIEFNPDIILISNGFDMHQDDPLAGLNLTSKFYVEVAKHLKEYNVPLIYVLEGGYNPDVIRDCSKEIIDELLK